VEQPRRAVALGFLYFTAVATSELFGHRWVKKGMSPRRAA